MRKDGGRRGRRRREEAGDFLEGVVDAVAAALLGDLVGGAFGREIGRESFGVGDAGEVGALEDVLVVGFGGEEEGGGLGGEGGWVGGAVVSLVHWLEVVGFGWGERGEG